MGYVQAWLTGIYEREEGMDYGRFFSLPSKHTHTHTHTYIYIHTFTHIHKYTYTHTHIYSTQTCTHANRDTYIHMAIHIHTKKYKNNTDIYQATIWQQCARFYAFMHTGNLTCLTYF